MELSIDMTTAGELDMKTAAQQLGIHLDSMRRYVREQKVRGVVKRGRNYYVPASEIARLKRGLPVTAPLAAA